MPTLDWIKLAFVFPVFFGFGPLLGVLIKNRTKAQHWVFGIMCFMTINGLLSAGNWGLTLNSVELYRGHTKGYHFYFNHILAIALITAAWLEDRKRFRWVPPGMFLYGLLIVVSSLSLVNAPRVDYALMALHKTAFFALINLAAFSHLRTVEDIRRLMVIMSGTIIWESISVLKLKFIDRQYQVHGTFEHQNSLAMYTILIAMPLLAAGLGPKVKGQGWFVAGFLSSAIIIQGALSRASLLMFTVGVAGVAILSVLEKPTGRRFTVLGGMGFVAAIGLSLTLDTIISRFHDQGNDASAELRVVLNDAARMMVRDYKLGVGWNNYAEVVNYPYPYAEVIYDWIRGRGMTVYYDLPNAPAESHYWLLISENGYPGLTAWLLVIGVALWRNFLGFLHFKHSFERCVCMGIMVSTSLNYIQSTLERTLTQPRNLMLWLILYAVTGRLELIRRAERKKARQARLNPSSETRAAIPAAVTGAPPPLALPMPIPSSRSASAGATLTAARGGGGSGKSWPSSAGWAAAAALRDGQQDGGTRAGHAASAQISPGFPGLPPA